MSIRTILLLDDEYEADERLKRIPLAGWLQDITEDDLDDVIYALEDLGDEQAVDLLILLLDYPASNVRSSVISALKQIGDPRAFEPIFKLLYPNPDDEFSARRSVILALSKFPDPRALPPLKALLLYDSDPYVRRDTAKTLGRLAQIDDGVVIALMAALHDPEWSVRREATEALGRHKEKRAENSIRSLLENPLRTLHISVYYALGMLGDIEAIKKLIDTLYWTRYYNHSYIRTHIVELLGELKNPLAVEVLIFFLGDDKIPWSWKRVSNQAASSLEQIGTPEALGAVAAWRKDPEPFIQQFKAASYDLVSHEPPWISKDFLPDDTLIKIVHDVVESYAGDDADGQRHFTQNNDGTMLTVVDVIPTEGSPPKIKVSMLVRIFKNRVVIEYDQYDKLLVEALVQAGIPLLQICQAHLYSFG